MPDWLGLCAFSLLLSLLSVAAWLVYAVYPLFSDVTVRTGPAPLKKITFAYKFQQGPYKSYRQLFRESLGIGPKLSCIGVFYDDPKKVKIPISIPQQRDSCLSTIAEVASSMFSTIQWFNLIIRPINYVMNVSPLDGGNVLLTQG